MRDEQRRLAGGKTDKGNWYKKKGKEKTTSVMTVPYTGGVLANEVRNKIALCKEIDGIKRK